MLIQDPRSAFLQVPIQFPDHLFRLVDTAKALFCISANGFPIPLVTSHMHIPAGTILLDKPGFKIVYPDQRRLENRKPTNLYGNNRIHLPSLHPLLPQILHTNRHNHIQILQSCLLNPLSQLSMLIYIRFNTIDLRHLLLIKTSHPLSITNTNCPCQQAPLPSNTPSSKQF